MRLIRHLLVGRRRAVAILALAAALVASAMVTGLDLPHAAAAEPGIGVQINGYLQAFDPAPFIHEGRTLVPLRSIFERLGAAIQWNGETQTVTATRGSRSVELTIGAATALVDGNMVRLDVPGLLKDGRTFVPLRFVAEALGGAVGWHSRTRTAVIVDLYELYGDAGPAPGSPLALLRLALANQAEPDGDVTAGLRFASIDPGEQTAITAALHNYRRGADAYWRVEQDLSFAGFGVAQVSELVQRAGQTWLRRPAEPRLQPVASAGSQDLGIPADLDPTRPLANPLISAIQSVTAGEVQVIGGERYRPLAVTFNGNRIHDYFLSLARQYGTDVTGVSFRTLAAGLLVRESDGFSRQTGVTVDWTFTRAGPDSQPVETPWQLRLHSRWEPPAGDVPWPQVQ